MATLSQLQGISTSPNSSDEVDSYHDTPATKISPFSPQENRGQLKPAGIGLSRSKVPPQFLLFTPNGDFGSSASLRPQDPFVSGPDLSGTTQVSVEASKLSPNASAFTPTTLVDSGSGNAGVRKLKGQVSAAAAQDGVQVFQHYALAAVPNVNGPYFKLGMFSTECGTSRCVVVGQLAGAPSAKEINELFNPNAFPSRTQLLVGALDKVYIKFSDIRDAEKAMSWVNTLSHKWIAHYISPPEYALKSEPESSKRSLVSTYEGQVVMTAIFTRTPKNIDVDATGKLISELVSDYGNVMAFEVCPGKPLEVSYHMEFCDLRATDKALANLNELKFDTFVLTIVPYKPDLEANMQHPLRSSCSPMTNQELGFENAFSSMTLNLHDNGPLTPRTPPFSSFPIQSPPNSQFPFRKYPGGIYTPSSVSSFSCGILDQNPSWSPTYNPFSGLPQQSPIWSSFNPGTIGQERGTPLLSRTHQERCALQKKSQGQIIRRYVDNPSGHHNVVDIDRIRQGTDVRTTIMLRNIPNKIDQAMLKEIVDETSFGKYDFMYLRIDFANNCNVGYAFINFEDPYHIIDFVTTRAGQRWNRYNSDKVAEVSYATIQGRDCLIQKFRNSSVMLEHVSFRPKIFHTIGPRTGQEDTFPGPDNPSKMRRSVENAAHVGLFAPRAGQSFRDEQRRRRSQYDRGTRLAEIEDAFDDGSHAYRYQPNAFQASSPYGGLTTAYYPNLPGFGSPV